MASQKQCKGNKGLSLRSSKTDEKKMRPGNWLESALCVLMTLSWRHCSPSKQVEKVNWAEIDQLRSMQKRATNTVAGGWRKVEAWSANPLDHLTNVWSLAAQKCMCSREHDHKTGACNVTPTEIIAACIGTTFTIAVLKLYLKQRHNLG